jgi:hypothetical protein
VGGVAGLSFLAGAAAPGAEALDLAGLGRRNVVRTAAHLAHEPLLLHLAAELPKRLLELLGILYDDSHNRTRIAGARPPMLRLLDRRHAVGDALRVESGEEQVAAQAEQRQ